MAFKPSSADDKAMVQFLELVLDAYKSGRADRGSCAGVLAHVITAAALGNDGEFKAHIRLPEEELFPED
jgi:hypothetical protein